MTEPVEIIRARTLDGVAHGFLGRRGGISTGLYAGLNVGIGSDDDADVVETAARVGWLPRTDLKVVMADAFEYVQTSAEHFDFVAVDLFRGERLAGRTFGKPFLRSIRGLLEPRGRVAVNLFVDRRAPEREARIAVYFDIYQRRRIGGNMVIHARQRRGY